MFFGRSVCLLCLVLCACESASVFENIRDTFQDSVLRVAHQWTTRLNLNRHTREVEDNEEKNESVSNRKAYARLTFEQCGDEVDPIQVQGMKIEPNPIVIPGPMGVSINLNVRENQSSPIPVELEMSKKITLLFGLSSWFRIPCLPNGVGSCGYDDLCSIKLFKEGLCHKTPEYSVCGCPLTKGNYTSKMLTFNLPQVPKDVPDYLLHGEFFAKAIVKREDQELACYSTMIDLRDH